MRQQIKVSRESQEEHLPVPALKQKTRMKKPTPRPRPAKAHVSGKKLVLIVEDEDFLVLALKDSLEAIDCTVLVAEDGNQALLCVDKYHPDLILLDLLMPKRDGFFVLEKLKKDPKLRSIPVIVLSNLGGDKEIKGALERGADDYFVKSQHMIVEVIERVEEYLTGKRSVKVR